MTAPSATSALTSLQKQHSRLPIALLWALSAICLATLWAPPAGRTSWLLEVTPGLLMVTALGIAYRRMPLSHWVYVGAFVHVLILIYGGYYTYALTPLGNWAKEAFHLSRNHNDRVGHVASWISQVQELAESAQYRILFFSNPAILWQRRSLNALCCFAAHLITIDSTSN
jgi:uncharacterized membrane protein YjdF